MRTGLALALGVWVLAAGVRAQGPAADIWQGVYSIAQAERGRTVYMTACIRCHGADLTGTTAPALTGERFFQIWGGDSVSRLFEKIRDTMPPNFSTTLDDGAKLDIVAFILQTNGFPAGRDLPSGNALASIQILQKGEQPRVQNFALVQLVGCLAREDSRWVLRNSSIPAATSEAAAADTALPAAASVPLGTGRFELLNASPFGPAASDGRKVEVRGLIYQEAEDSLLTVTSLKGVGDCR